MTSLDVGCLSAILLLPRSWPSSKINFQAMTTPPAAAIRFANELQHNFVIDKIALNDT